MDNRNGSHGDKLVKTAYEACTDTELTRIVSQYRDNRDKEVMIILLSWLQNGTRHDNYAMHKICALVGDSPYQHVLSSEYGDVPSLHSFSASLTYGNLFEIMAHLRLCYENGGFETMFREFASREKFGHGVLAYLLSDGTKLPLKSYGAFYRYNLMLYLLTYKFAIWRDDYAYKTLLPCNDRIFDRAASLGITPKRLNTSLNSAITLTNIARERFGEDFYKMYELLAYG